MQLKIKFLNKVNRKIRSDGLFWGLYLFILQIFQRGSSIVYSLILHAPNISVGPGCQFMGVKFIKFGKNISIYRNLWLQAVTEYEGIKFEPEIHLGDRIKMSNGVHITSINKIKIGNDVLFGSNVYVSDHNHGGYSGDFHTPPSIPPAMRDLLAGGEVFIEDNVWIGDNVNIVGPVRIGYGSIIAANSVVRKDVPPQTIVAGAPAKIIKVFDISTGQWKKYL